MADEPTAERLDIEEEEEGGPVKSFLEHLEDLRWVLIKTLVAVGVGMLICLIGANHVVDILKRPLEKAKISYPGTNQVVTVFLGTNQLGVYPLSPQEQAAFTLGTNRYVAVRIEPMVIGTNTVIGWHIETNKDLAEQARRLKIDLLSLGPAQGFLTAFHVAIYGGIVLASPFIFYFIASFVFPALKMKERHYVYRGLGFGIGLFLGGAVFCYYLLMPVALAASQAYARWQGFSAYQWKADDYISFVCKFILGMGLGFEMPVVILTMVKIGILNYRILSKGRKYMIVINLILGAVLTTPEVITQLIMFLPLQLLYEISIWIAWYWERQEAKRLKAEASTQER
jgi:sec-independent protein translocase protein TatC